MGHKESNQTKTNILIWVPAFLYELSHFYLELCVCVLLVIGIVCLYFWNVACVIEYIQILIDWCKLIKFLILIGNGAIIEALSSAFVYLI